MSLEDIPSDTSFLQEIEDSLENQKDTVTDYEWNLLNRKWEEEKAKVGIQMLRNTIWNMLITQHKGQYDKRLAEHEQERDYSSSMSLSTLGATNVVSTVDSSFSNTPGPKDDGKQVEKATAQNTSNIVWKVPKYSKMELFKYLSDWDKSSYGKRDMIIMDFVHIYRTKDKVYDTDAVFCHGGSLIFCRFSVGVQICVLKNRKVWHYYDALSIFVKSLQGDRFAEEFMRLGGMAYIIQVVRVEESDRLDKLHACKFLVDLMESRNGHAVKMFILDTPHFLESLVDSLTMCKDKQVIESCGLIFQNLCIEITPQNVPLVCNFVMHAIPCDFNPLLQSMAFKVLQSLVRLKSSLSEKCIKPILDNLKTENNDLLVEMSNLSLVILQTKFGNELITALMVAAEGIQLRESFRSIFRPHLKKPKGQSAKEAAQELRKAKEKREKIRAKQLKFDHYMHQAGALFVLNRMMTNKTEFADDFISKGIFGLSLKTLGACPHWEVQGQGVTMVQFLHAVSVECAVSYYLMLPPNMMKLILQKPEECLRYFTSPICVFLRKLGRFALRMWPRWVEKVVEPAKMYAHGSQIPDEIFKLSKMAKKVHEIQNAIADLLDNPVMEAVPKTPTSEVDEEVDNYDQDFLDSDDENLGQYRDGKEVIMGDSRFESFRGYLDDQDYEISEDRLDARVDVAKPSVLIKVDEDAELDAYQIAVLEDAQNTKSSKKILHETPGEDGDELTNSTIQNRTIGSVDIQDAFIDL